MVPNWSYVHVPGVLSPGVVHGVSVRRGARRGAVQGGYRVGYYTGYYPAGYIGIARAQLVPVQRFCVHQGTPGPPGPFRTPWLLALRYRPPGPS